MKNQQKKNTKMHLKMSQIRLKLPDLLTKWLFKWMVNSLKLNHAK